MSGTAQSSRPFCHMPPKRRALDPRIAAGLAEGRTVIVPTETVVGLAARAVDAAALDGLFAMKARDPDKPFAVCVSDLAQAETLGMFSDAAIALATVHWPGPLTIIVPARAGAPLSRACLSSYAGRDTVAFRCPDIFWRDALCAEPLALTSANLSGQQTCATVEDARRAFPTALYIEERGKGPRDALPSTIVRVMNGTIDVLRQGALVLDDAP